MIMTVELVVDSGAEALHRVTTVLAHQRADIRALAMVAGEGTAPARLTLELDGPGRALDQVFKRLHRAHCVREARRTAGPEAAGASP